MARIRRTAFWAVRLLGVLAISLFTVMHLTPPAWAKAVGDKDRQTDNINEEELTSLIADLGVEEELQRLSGTAATSQNLAQAPQPGDSIELLPLKDLAPPADVLMQAPNLRTQQAPVEGGADLLYGGPGPRGAGAPARPYGKVGQSLRVPSVQPQQTPSVEVQRVPTIQPQQIQKVQPQLRKKTR